MPYIYDSSDEDLEEDEEEEFEMWNPNNLIDEIRNAPNPEKKAELKKQLLEYFLDQQRPMLTQKMKEYFLEAGVIPALIGFVSRPNERPVPKPEDNNNANGVKKSKPINRQFNVEAEEETLAQQRSFKVMANIFMNPNQDLDVLLDNKLDEILFELFKIFQVTSGGNFYHFNKILLALVSRAPVETTASLLSQQLMWQMLDNIHEPAVLDTLIDLFSGSFPRQHDTIQFYKALIEHKVFERIGQKIYGKDQINAAYASEFFVRLLEKLASHELSGILFINLCKNSNFVDGLFKVIVADDGTHPQNQKLACAHVLRELLIKSGEKVFDQSEFSRPLPNMLSAIHDKVHEYSKPYVEPLCNTLINIDQKRTEKNPLNFSAYSVKKPMGTYTFTLVEILSDILCTLPSTLDQVPSQTWRVLSSWFVEYSHNNLYHYLFHKIFRTVLRENHLESLKTLFNKYKFLGKILEHYKSGELSSARGHIINMCNALRFTAELQPVNGVLRHYLATHDLWKEFLPQLKKDTMLFVRSYGDFDEEDQEDEDSIELGSSYAHSLGFTELPPAPTEGSPKTPKKKKKKKKKKISLSGNSIPTNNNNNISSPQPNGKSPNVKEQAVTESSNGVDSWWNDLKSDLEQTDHQTQQDSTDWWDSLKSELETSSPAPPPEKKNPKNDPNTPMDSMWWNDMKAELESQS